MKTIVLILSIILNALPMFSQTLEWHIRDNYVDVEYMGNDLFKVMNSSGKWGIINRRGDLTVDVQHDVITPLVENRALLLDITGQYLKGIVNENGQIIKSFYNNEMLANYKCFCDGMLAYGIDVGSYYMFGYLDIYGNTKITPQYYWAAPFHNGKAVVQYESRNFGLIDTSGRTVLNDNRKFKFMSTPVGNKMLIATGSNRGDKVTLVNVSPDGKLNDIENLEIKTIVKSSTDYKSISCVNGHKYHFDDAMRLIFASTGRSFNQPWVVETPILGSTCFSKVRAEGLWKILYYGTPLMCSSFKDISFCDNEYIIVKNQRNKVGVLKLNLLGKVEVVDVSDRAVFHHYNKSKGYIAFNIKDLLPSTRVQIGIVGLHGNSWEERYTLPDNYRGIYNLPISYFIPAKYFDREATLRLNVNIYLNGMLHKTDVVELKGVHKPAFEVSEAMAPEFSAPDGRASVFFYVQSLESRPSSSTKVEIRGYSDQDLYFSGKNRIDVQIPVIVPLESSKTFSFTVTIKEDNCPPYIKTVKRTVKHYDLQ